MYTSQTLVYTFAFHGLVCARTQYMSLYVTVCENPKALYTKLEFQVTLEVGRGEIS